MTTDSHAESWQVPRCARDDVQNDLFEKGEDALPAGRASSPFSLFTGMVVIPTSDAGARRNLFARRTANR